MKRKRLTTEIRTGVTSMLKAGQSPVAIAEHFGISSSSVSRIKKRANGGLFPQVPNSLTSGQRAAITRENNKRAAIELAAASAFRTIKYGNDRFIVPASKGVQFKIDEAGFEFTIL